MNTAKAKLVSVVLALGLLVAGGFVGAMVDRTWIRGSEVTKPTRSARGSKRMLERFKHRLKLDDKQAAAIEQIMKTARDETRALRKKRREDILKLLNPEQQAEYKKMIKRQNERRKARRAKRRARRDKAQ